MNKNSSQANQMIDFHNANLIVTLPFSSVPVSPYLLNHTDLAFRDNHWKENSSLMQAQGRQKPRFSNNPNRISDAAYLLQYDQRKEASISQSDLRSSKKNKTVRVDIFAQTFNDQLPQVDARNTTTADSLVSPRYSGLKGSSNTSKRFQYLQQEDVCRYSSSPNYHMKSKKRHSLTQRNWKETIIFKKTSDIKDDSIYQQERIPINQRTLRAATLRKNCRQSVQENDSLFCSQNREAILGLDSGQFNLQQVNRKTNSIYSIKEQLMVEKILRKRFKELQSPCESLPANVGIATDKNSYFKMSNSFSSNLYTGSNMSRRASNACASQDPHHLQQKQLLVQQTAVAQFCESRSKNLSIRSSNTNKKKSVCLSETKFMTAASSPDKDRHNSRFKNSQVFQQPQQSKGHRNSLTQFTLRKNTQPPMSIMKHSVTDGSAVSKEKIIGINASQTVRLCSQQSPRKSMINFVASNKKDLFKSTTQKLHPQFNVWPKSGDNLNCRLDRQSMVTSEQEHIRKKRKTVKDDASSSDSDYDLPPADRKLQLISDMQKRVITQTNYNAQEILSSVGVSSHRAARQQKQQQSDQQSQQFNTHPHTSQGDFIQTADQYRQQEIAVKKIIQFAEKTRKEKEDAKYNASSINQMIGKSKFQIPSNSKLKDYYNSVKKNEKGTFIMNIADGKNELASKICIKDYDKKIERDLQNKDNPYKEHVQKFTNNEFHLFKAPPSIKNSEINSFADSLREDLEEQQHRQLSSRMEEEVKEQEERSMSKQEIEESLANMVKDGQYTNGSIFNRCLEEETTLVYSMGLKFLDNINYMMRYGQREVEHEGNGIVNMRDPKVQYFLKCKQDLDLVLPILDKVCRKTLMLQEYTLSPGHCRGLAEACKFFDHRFVNRVFLNNCGIDDSEFSSILQGLTELKDFKSIIYKANMFGEKSLVNLQPLLLKRIPNHLEELTLIDCHMSISHVSKLTELLLTTKPQLKKLSLVNASHTENSFARLTLFLEQSEHLQELDLSWSKLTLLQWCSFMQVIKENRTLVSLNISYNKILEQQPTPANMEPFSDETWQLSSKNQEIMDCLKNFIKYNVHLVTLNLENTGMNHQAVAFVASLLRKSQALRCIHLSANEGINKTLIDWIRKRIHSKERVTPNVIQPYQQMKNEYNKIKTKGAMKLGQALFLAKQHQILEKIRQDNQWLKIREGIKLRNIVLAKRMNEVVQNYITSCMGDVDIDMEGSFISNKLTISRILGQKTLIADLGRWTVHDNNKSECWKCCQHVFTIFLWTPQIGRQSCEKDPSKTKYYRDQLESLRDTDEFFAMNESMTPLFVSSFNGWRYEKMREVVPFCMQNDLSPPDFVQECIEDGLIKPGRSGILTADQKYIVQLYKETHYKRFWQDCLLKLTRFNKPQIANAHLITKESLLYVEDNPVYVHFAWVPPGRHTYCISHSADYLKTQLDNQIQNTGILLNNNRKKDTVLKQDFYVHDMLSTFREESIPFYFNPRHISRVKKEQYRERPVFNQWIPDTADTLSQMLTHDKNFWSFRDICQSDKEYKGLEFLIVENFELFKDAYHYLQSWSKTYPFVSFTAARRHFFVPAIIKQGFSARFNIFDTVIKQANYKDQCTEKSLNRAEFIELFVLLARYILQEEGNAHLYGITLVKSVKLFIDQCLKKFLSSNQVEWQIFRDEKLYQTDVRLLFSMNEIALREIFTIYAGRGRGLGLKDKSFQGMVIDDAMQLILKDAKIMMDKHQVKEAYVFSKMTVVEESNSNAHVTYNKMVYVEFLEFLARVAELFFRGSEMENLLLHKKLEHLLDQLLPVIDAKQVKQVTVIEEFSESDDDY